MKVAITGATGSLGQALVATIQEQEPSWEMIAFYHNDPLQGSYVKVSDGPQSDILSTSSTKISSSQVTWKKLDITDFDATYKTITKLNADVVIHLAAIRSPDLCEKNPKDAYRINFLGTRNVALACDKFDTALIYVSTDQVFYGADPQKTHEEYDPPKPNNVYGHTKLLGEEFVGRHLRRYWIIRTAKLFGGPGDTFSFVQRAFETLSSNKELSVVKDWVTHATYNYDLSNCLIQLIHRGTYGIYHIVSRDVCSYWDIATLIARKLQRPNSLLVATTLEKLGLKAPRTTRTMLSTKLWEADFGQSLPTWQESIEKFLAEKLTKVS